MYPKVGPQSPHTVKIYIWDSANGVPLAPKRAKCLLAIYTVCFPAAYARTNSPH